MEQTNDTETFFEEEDSEPSFSLRIDNVVQSRVNGELMYTGFMSLYHAERMTTVKRWDDPSGTGYQRPLSVQRANAFAKYMTTEAGKFPIFMPVLLNARGKWQFYKYENMSTGYLICTKKATILDGQHRIEGLKKLGDSPEFTMQIPFLAISNMDPVKEIEVFNTINSEAKILPKSHSYYLARSHDETAWVATELLTAKDSPFYNIGTVTGQRNRVKGRRITLQNMHKAVTLLTKPEALQQLSKETRRDVLLAYFKAVHDLFPESWKDYDGQRITHTVGLNALSMAGGMILPHYIERGRFKQYDFVQDLQRLSGFSWSIDRIGHLSGMKGSQELAEQIVRQMEKTTPLQKSS